MTLTVEERRAKLRAYAEAKRDANLIARYQKLRYDLNLSENATFQDFVDAISDRAQIRLLAGLAGAAGRSTLLTPDPEWDG